MNREGALVAGPFFTNLKGDEMPDYIIAVLQFIGGWGFLFIVIILMDRWFKN